MQVMVGLLRAVNVGGTGKLPMADLVALCEAMGFGAVRTYIASGNVLFESTLTIEQAKSDIEAGLERYAGHPVRVIMRSAADLAKVVACNPFPNAPGNQVTAIFLDQNTTASTLEGVTGRGSDEEVRLGRREIYVRYGSGIGRSKLRIPVAERGTARNMNTVAKLAAMATS